MQKKKTEQLTIRMDENLYSQLKQFEETSGVSPSTLARAAINAALKYYFEKRQITFPLACLPERDLGENYLTKLNYK